jgi:hypothetical protein
MEPVMRVIAFFVALSVQAAPPRDLPPAYPRTGATRILDNPAVQVWNIAWLKDSPSPLHRHIYDLAGVYYEPGDRLIISPEGVKRPVSTKAWDVTSQRVGVTHIEQGTSDRPLRAIFVEMKKQESYGTAAATEDAPAFSGAGATRRLDNDRVTVWEYIGPIAPVRHTHSRDTVAVAFESAAPRVAWIPKGTAHADEGAPNAARVYLFELK